MISGNDNLISVELIIPKIDSQGDFKIENNPKLTNLDLSTVRDFEVKRQLLVTSNKALIKFSLDQLAQFIVRRFVALFSG